MNNFRLDLIRVVLDKNKKGVFNEKETFLHIAMILTEHFKEEKKKI